LVANAAAGNDLPFESGSFWTLPLEHWRNMFDSGVPGGHLFYDLAMNATSRLAHDMARDLGPRGVNALAVSPGFTRTEAIVAALGPNPPGSDSIEFSGRAVRALLEDPNVGRHAGRTMSVAELSEEYGFSDIEGAEEGTGAR
jgi:dehydrogenase/reductase SDR family member 1